MANPQTDVIFIALASNNKRGVKVNKEAACSVSPVIRAALAHPGGDQRTVLVEAANEQVLVAVCHLINRFGAVDSTKFHPPCPVLLADKTVADYAREGEADALHEGIAKHVEHLWNHGKAESKRAFYDVIKALDYIRWDYALEYFYCHIATVTIRYKGRSTLEVAAALDPRDDTRPPSVLETDAKKRPGPFTKGPAAKRARRESETR